MNRMYIFCCGCIWLSTVSYDTWHTEMTTKWPSSRNFDASAYKIITCKFFENGRHDSIGDVLDDIKHEWFDIRNDICVYTILFFFNHTK